MKSNQTRLHRIMDKVPITAEEVCKRLSMNRNTYYSYLSGKRNAAMMPALQFFLLASIMQTRPEDLLDAAMEDHRDRVYRSDELYNNLTK